MSDQTIDTNKRQDKSRRREDGVRADDVAMARCSRGRFLAHAQRSDGKNPAKAYAVHTWQMGAKV